MLAADSPEIELARPERRVDAFSTVERRAGEAAAQAFNACLRRFQRCRGRIRRQLNDDSVRGAVMMRKMAGMCPWFGKIHV